MALKVLSFYQEGCMGCEEQTPINRIVEKDLGIEIEEINAAKHPEYIRQYSLRVTPTILVVEDGEVRERMEGLTHREDLEAVINRHRT
jgi:thioredoxin 1